MARTGLAILIGLALTGISPDPAMAAGRTGDNATPGATKANRKASPPSSATPKARPTAQAKARTARQGGAGKPTSSRRSRSVQAPPPAKAIAPSRPRQGPSTPPPSPARDAPATSEPDDLTMLAGAARPATNALPGSATPAMLAASPAALAAAMQAASSSEPLGAQGGLAQAAPGSTGSAAPSPGGAGPSALQSLQGYQTLQRLVLLAAERSAAIREARAQVRAHALDVRQASGARLPQVTLDVQSRYARGAGDTEASAASGSPFYSVTGSMPIYDFGRISRTVASRTAAQQAAEARLDAALDDVALETILAALDVAHRQGELAATDRYLDTLRQLTRVLDEGSSPDSTRAMQAAQARSRLLQIQLSRDALAGRLREAEIELHRLTGRQDVPVDQIGASLLTVPSLQTFLDGLPDQPDLRALDAERQAQTSLAQSLASERLPQLSVVVSRGPVAPGVVYGYGSYAGVNLNVPLYRGGADAAAQRAAEQRAISAAERRDQRGIDLHARLRMLHESASTQLGRVAEYRRLRETTEQVRRAALQRWQRARDQSLVDLLIAEQEHYAIQIAWLDTYYSGIRSNARLHGEAGALSTWLGLRDIEGSGISATR